MNAVDIILILLIGLAVIFAVRSALRRNKKGGCGCGSCAFSDECGDSSLKK